MGDFNRLQARAARNASTTRRAALARAKVSYK